MKMNQYIKYILSLVLIFSNLSVAFSMHLCKGEVREIKLNHLDNNHCEMNVAKSCCPSKVDKNCEIPKGDKEEQGDCCVDLAYTDHNGFKQIVTILELTPIHYVSFETLKVDFPVIPNSEENKLNFLDFYVASNAPPNYIINSQLTFYEG